MKRLLYVNGMPTCSAIDSVSGTDKALFEDMSFILIQICNIKSPCRENSGLYEYVLDENI